MKTSRFIKEQITYLPRLSESGTPVANVCRQTGIAEATFDVCKKKYASLSVSELRQLQRIGAQIGVFRAECSVGLTSLGQERPATARCIRNVVIAQVA